MRFFSEVGKGVQTTYSLELFRSVDNFQQVKIAERCIRIVCASLFEVGFYRHEGMNGLG